MKINSRKGGNIVQELEQLILKYHLDAQKYAIEIFTKLGADSWEDFIHKKAK